MLLTIMYAVWTNIYIMTLLSVMYEAMSNKIRIKAAPLAAFLRFLRFSSAERGIATLGKRKKAAKWPGLNLIKPNNYDYHVRFFL